MRIIIDTSHCEAVMVTRRCMFLKVVIIIVVVVVVTNASFADASPSIKQEQRRIATDIFLTNESSSSSPFDDDSKRQTVILFSKSNLTDNPEFDTDNDDHNSHLLQMFSTAEDNNGITNSSNRNNTSSNGSFINSTTTCFVSTNSTGTIMEELWIPKPTLVAETNDNPESNQQDHHDRKVQVYDGNIHERSERSNGKIQPLLSDPLTIPDNRKSTKRTESGTGPTTFTTATTMNTGRRMRPNQHLHGLWHSIRDDFTFRGIGISLYKSFVDKQSAGISFRLPILANFDWMDSRPYLPSLNLMAGMYIFPLRFSISLSSSVPMETIRVYLYQCILAVYEFVMRGFHHLLSSLWTIWSLLAFPFTQKWDELPNNLHHCLNKASVAHKERYGTKIVYNPIVMERFGFTYRWNWRPLTNHFETTTSFWHCAMPRIVPALEYLIQMFIKMKSSINNMENNRNSQGDDNSIDASLIHKWLSSTPFLASCAGIDTSIASPTHPSWSFTGIFSLSGLGCRGRQTDYEKKPLLKHDDTRYLSRILQRSHSKKVLDIHTGIDSSGTKQEGFHTHKYVEPSFSGPANRKMRKNADELRRRKSCKVARGGGDPSKEISSIGFSTEQLSNVTVGSS